jgi:hypothetical protein
MCNLFLYLLLFQILKNDKSKKHSNTQKTIFIKKNLFHKNLDIRRETFSKHFS